MVEMVEMATLHGGVKGKRLAWEMVEHEQIWEEIGSINGNENGRRFLQEMARNSYGNGKR
jgi:hypothetical protein